jgi:hypothetical protein
MTEITKNDVPGVNLHRYVWIHVWLLRL